MLGTILYPLNTLKEVSQEIYMEEVGKYTGREKILNREVTPLHCLWNDVLHLTAVHPQELKENLAKAGFQYKPMLWFKIPTNIIEGSNSIVFIQRKSEDPTSYIREYKTFDIEKMSTYRTVPSETIEYYKQKKFEGEKPLLFHLIPHILYKGKINTDGLEIVTV